MPKLLSSQSDHRNQMSVTLPSVNQPILPEGEKVHALSETMTASEMYVEAINREAVRVLSLMDREMLSPTFGCLDRTYWAWKFTDFPGARFQEGLCTLSFLYANDFEGNEYYQKQKLLKWIVGGFNFWTNIQHRHGDFDEAYPFEHSLAATAFTTFYLSEAWNFLQGQMPEDTASQFKGALQQAGQWLIHNDEKHGFLSNHLAAAAVALYHIYTITGEERFETRSRYFIDKILDHQSSEGWYEEYGGADPGYQTHGSFYLARYFELSHDTRLLGSLDHSFKFLANFVHPDKSLGGEYASRNTQTYYPAAFEMMSAVNGRAAWISSTMLPSIKSLAAAGLGTVDAYNYFPLLNNYVFAYLACLKPGHRTASPEPPTEDFGMTHFPQAGLLKVRTDKYDLFVGLNKGGVLKAFDRQKHQLVFNDCGYIGRMKNGKLLSSQWIESERKINIDHDEILIEGDFYQISKLVMSPFSFLGFRVFCLTVGRFRRVSYWLKSLLVNVLIYRKRKLDLHLTRRISLHQDRVIVQDHIQGSIGEHIEDLKRCDVFTTIHMGSSRYFIPNELGHGIEVDEARDAQVDVREIEQGLLLERTYVIR